MKESVLITVETVPAWIGYRTLVGYMESDDPSRGNCFSFHVMKSQGVRSYKCINMMAELEDYRDVVDFYAVCDEDDGGKKALALLKKYGAKVDSNGDVHRD